MNKAFIDSQWPDIRRIADDTNHVSKYVFHKADAVSEAVLYRYPTYRERTVICCSTQSGCPVGCRFCGSGDYFVRSLNPSEIVAQVNQCLADIDCEPNEIDRLQIMFMSMGEPLLNLKGLVPALEMLYKAYPKAALLISTSAPKVNYGIVRNISRQIPTVGLQFSVHESTDEARNALIPFKAKLTLDEIADEGERWYEATGRKPFFNYCAHDKNSGNEDACRIYALFDPRIWNATVSVVCERSEGLAASNEHQRDLAGSFANELVRLGYDTRTFDPAGQDTIGGGCGQLWFVQDWMRKNPKLARPSVGHGKEAVHTPGEKAA